MLGTAALAGLLVAGQSVANADSMKIKAGDTVWAYAQKYHVSVDKIAEANNLSNPGLIIAGHTINIPGVETGEATTTTTTASASSSQATSAATSSSSQATSAATSSATSASSTSQAASSSSVAAQSSSTSTASASSVASNASTSSVASQASSSAATSSSTSQSSTTAASTSSNTGVTSSSSAQSSAASSSSNTSATSTSTQRATTYKAAAQTTTSTATTGSVIGAAKTFLGTPYEQMDCSAFTQAAFAKAGRSIGRTTYAQATLGTHVSFSQAQAGDLVFWGSDSAPYHVGIYLGGGQYIASPDYGDVVSIKSTTYFTPSFAIHM